MKRNGGFTLVELVVVIVILGILAGIAAPKFFEVKGEARNSEMKALASSINKSIEMVHAKAMLENKTLQVRGSVLKVVIGGETILLADGGYPVMTIENIRKMLTQMSPTIQSQGTSPLLLYPADNDLRRVTNVSKTNLPDGCYVAVWGSITSGDDLIPPVAKAPVKMKCN